MLEKKKAFEAEFKHVWGSSATGLSIATIDMPDYNSANNLITKLFEKTLIADVHSYSSVTRVYKSVIDLSDARSNIVRSNVQRVVAITSDDRVAEMIEAVVDITKNENIDVMVRQMTAASKEYNKWAALQTEAQQEGPKFYEKDAFANSKPVSSEEIASMTDYKGGKGVNPTRQQTKSLR
jgi:uncharacterized protein involved in tolerance to divalent cations